MPGGGHRRCCCGGGDCPACRHPDGSGFPQQSSPSQYAAEVTGISLCSGYSLTAGTVNGTFVLPPLPSCPAWPILGTGSSCAWGLDEIATILLPNSQTRKLCLTFFLESSLELGVWRQYFKLGISAKNPPSGPFTPTLECWASAMQPLVVTATYFTFYQSGYVDADLWFPSRRPCDRQSNPVSNSLSDAAGSCAQGFWGRNGTIRLTPV